MTDTRPCYRLLSRYLTRIAGILAVLLAWPVAGAGAATPAELERSILGAIERGEDVRPLAEQWRRTRGEVGENARTGRVDTGARLVAALTQLERALAEVERGGDPHGIAEAYAQAQAAELLHRDDLKRAKRRLDDAALPAEYGERLATAARTIGEPLAALFAQLERLAPSAAGAEPALTGAAARAAAGRARQLIGERLLAPVRTVPLRSVQMPVRPANYGARSPRQAPPVTPAYRNPTDGAVEAADSAAGDEAPLDDEILAQARLLGHDYVKIHDYLRNRIRTEWYAGSVKGALGVLRSGGGNDVDQAALLIALMRASGAPARYVRGVVERPVDALAGEMGISDPAAVPAALARAGIAYSGIERGGRIAAVHMEHTWVEVRIPYTNYRGILLDASGKTWLPVDPTVKGLNRQAATLSLSRLGQNADALLADYLSQARGGDLLSHLQTRLSATLSPGQTYADLLGKSEIAEQALGLLPNTLPYQVIAITGESAALAPEQIVRARIRYYPNEDGSGEPSLDVSYPVAELSNRRFTLSYLPATLDDHRTALLWGGIDQTPAYLIRVRPQLRIGGENRDTGTVAQSPGALAKLVIDLSGPAGSESIDQIVMVGAYQAIVLGAPVATRPAQAPVGDNEQQAARLLDGVARRYLEQWTRAENELATLLGLPLVRPLPSLVLVGNALRGDRLAGVDLGTAWRGVTLDAALRISEPVGAESARQEWFVLAAAEGSSLEHTVFEEQFQVESISADKGLALAKSGGQTVARIDGGNLAGQVAGLNLAPEVIADITARVRLGMVVTVPTQPLTVNQWSGAVWRAEHPATRAAGYFIAGRLAGGSTTLYPWPLQFLEDALAGANNPDPNNDPMAAASIDRVPATDGQKGTAGKALDTALRVLVRDRDGRPVRGAEVTFTAARGQGTFGGNASITVPTTAAGIAEAILTLGEKTSDNPFYLRRQPNDKYPYQVGLNIVEASVVSSKGTLRPDEPFAAYGFPGDVDKLQRTDLYPRTEGLAGYWLTTANFGVFDKFENPVANVDVSFAAQSPVNTCSPGPSSPPKPAKLASEKCGIVPIYGDCGSSSLSSKTGTFGTTAVYVFIDAVNNTLSPVTVTAGGKSKTINFGNSSSCNRSANMLVSTFYLVGNTGVNMNATKAGKKFPMTIYIRTDYSIPRTSGGSSCTRLPDQVLIPATDAQLRIVTVRGLGSASPPVQIGSGLWKTEITTGSLPDENQFILEFSGSPPDPCSGSNPAWGNMALPSVWGLEAKIDTAVSIGVPSGVDPERVHLENEGHSVFPLGIGYHIAPAAYLAGYVDIELRENQSALGYLPVSSFSGTGEAILERGYVFDINKKYEAELRVNPGSDAEVLSDPYELPLRQKLIKWSTGRLRLSTDIDIVNERICQMGSQYQFALNEAARVTLKAYARDDSTGDPGNSAVTLIDDDYAQGEHSMTLTPGDLLPRKNGYLLELTAVSQRDSSLQEQNLGSAAVMLDMHDSLPVGQVVVQGVNLKSGRLLVPGQSLGVPGRGPQLAFKPSYSTGGAGVIGNLGTNWTHNFEAGLSITPCGDVLVSTGDTGSIRFLPGPNNTLIPAKGYHATLIANNTDHSFDLYSKNGTHYHFSFYSLQQKWKLAQITDANGNSLTLSYETGPLDILLNKVEDSFGRSISFIHQSRFFAKTGGISSVISQVIGPDGMMLSYAYDDYGNLISSTRENGAKETYTYLTDANDLILKNSLQTYTNIKGQTLHATYTPSSTSFSNGRLTITAPDARVASVTATDGGVTSFTYAANGDGQVTDVSGAGGNATYTLNKYGAPVSIADAAGTVTMSWATDDIVMTGKTDANGVAATYAYDSAGNLLQESKGGYSTSATWQIQSGPPYRKDLQTSHTDRNGFTTSYQYDAQGNLVGESRPIGSISYSVAGNGDRLSMTDGNGQTTQYRYTSEGLLSETVDPLGGVQSTAYNARGYPIRTVDAEGRTTDFSYDSFDHLVGRSASYGSRSYQHDILGNKLSETDEDGRTVSYSYDDGNRPTSVTTPVGSKSISYDIAGNKIAETDFRGNITSYAYDGANRLVTRTEPLGKITRYSYDGNGNVLRETDANGGVTAYSYDGLNRRTGIVNPLNGVTTITVDGNGNQVAVTDANGVLTRYGYDGLNRRVSETRDGATIGYDYDNNGNLVAVSDGNGKVTRHDYDGANRRIKTTDPLGNTRRYDYDRVGNLLQEVDPRVNARKYSYNAANLRVRQVDQAGFVTTYYYSGAGDLQEERWANGNVVTYSYDQGHRRTGQSDSLGVAWTADYDADGNKVSESDGNGNLSRHDYDALKRKTRSQLAGGRTLEYRYDPAGNLVGETDANGNVVTHRYDAGHRRIKTEDALGVRWTGRYDPMGNLVGETDGNGNAISHYYDAHNRRIKTEDALGVRWSADYDPAGNKIRERDGNGVLKEYTYDGRNQLLSVQRAGEVQHRYEYDEAGNLASDSDALGNKTGYEYDGRNLRTAENGPLAAIRKTRYNPMGDPIEHTDPENRKSTSGYDLRRRMISVSNGLGDTTITDYDGNGNPIKVTRPEGNSRRYDYDPANRLIAITSAAASAGLEYDGNGNLTARTDGNGNRNEYRYDARNRRTRTLYPDGAQELTEPDGNGNPVRYTDARGNRIDHRYDARNRRTLSRYGSGPDGLTRISQSYDGNGNRLSSEIEDGSGIRNESAQYDAHDRQISATDAWRQTVTHSYNAAGDRIATSAQGGTSQYRYDALHRRIGILSAGGAVSLSYDRSGLPTVIQYPDGSRSATGYDQAGRPNLIEHSRAGIPLGQHSLSYDRNGNTVRQTVSENGRTRTHDYRYDPDDRLVEEKRSDGSGTRNTEWTLDGAGNRTGERHDGSGGYAGESYQRQYVVNTRNQVTRIDQSGANAGRTDYGYDADGHLLQQTHSAGRNLEYVWNLRGQLVDVSENGSPLGRYRYTVDGLRQERNTGGGTTRTQWIDGFAALDSDGDNVAQARYEAGPNGRSPVLMSTATGTENLHSDGLGSVTLSTGSGSVLARTEYDAWGRGEKSGASGNKFGYTGHQQDDETGLIYFKARYYDPTLGRFIGQDALEGEANLPISWAKYLYANGNPLTYIDPSGMYSWSEFVDDVDSFAEKFTQGIETATQVFSKATEKRPQQQPSQDALPPSTSPVIDRIKGGGRAVLALGKGDPVAVYSPTYAPTDFPVGTPGTDSYREPVDVATPRNSAEQSGFDATNKAIVVAAVASGGKSLVTSIRGARAGIAAARDTEATLEAAARNQSVTTKVDATLTKEQGTIGVGASSAKTTRSAEAKAGAMEETARRNTQIRSESQATEDVGKTMVRESMEGSGVVLQKTRITSRGYSYDPDTIYFGQKGVSPEFGSKGEFAGASLDDLAEKLLDGRMMPDDFPIKYIVEDGVKWTVNNRSLTVLSKAGMKPSVTIDMTGNLPATGPDSYRSVMGRLKEIGFRPQTEMPVRMNSDWNSPIRETVKLVRPQ